MFSVGPYLYQRTMYYMVRSCSMCRIFLSTTYSSLLFSVRFRVGPAGFALCVWTLRAFFTSCRVSSRLSLVWGAGACVFRSTEIVFRMRYSSMNKVLARTSRCGLIWVSPIAVSCTSYWQRRPRCVSKLSSRVVSQQIHS